MHNGEPQFTKDKFSAPKPTWDKDGKNMHGQTWEDIFDKKPKKKQQ